MILSPRAKLAFTALLFLIALGPLVLAASTHSADPLFFMWIPLLAVPWVLARPESPGERSARAPAHLAAREPATDGEPPAGPSSPEAEAEP